MRTTTIWTLTLACTTSIACGAADGDGETGSETGAAPEQVEGCDIVLRGGRDDRDAVQTALSEAADGSAICFAGTFEITTDQLIATEKVGLTLKGIDAGDAAGAGAVFDFKDTVGPTGFKLANMQGLTVENFTIKNVKGDGLEVRGSTDVIIRKMNVTWERGADTTNGAYAFYPVESTNILMEDNEASFTADAGIYVGQSQNIVVRRNRAFSNVSGIQIENSKNIEVYENEAWDNTLGIFVHDLPAVPAGNGGGALIRDNDVHDNDRSNFAKEGIIARVIPPGLGIMVLTLDRVEITGNTVRGNDSAGIIVVSYKTVEQLDPPDRDPDPNYDPFPETIDIHDNTLEANGDAPDPLFAALGVDAMADIAWDGIADPAKDGSDGSLRVCIRDNGAASFINLGVATMMPSTDLAPHDCEHAPQPSVDNGLD